MHGTHMLLKVSGDTTSTPLCVSYEFVSFILFLSLMGSSLHTIKNGIIFSLTFLLCTFGIVYAAISWPASAPSGETAGGKFASYLSKMLVNSDIATTDGKVKSAESADEVSGVGEYICVSLNKGGGAQAGNFALSTWVNLGSLGYAWKTDLNSAPSTFSHNGNGTITVAKRGLYHFRYRTMFIPTTAHAHAEVTCPIINGLTNCGPQDSMPYSHRYTPAAEWNSVFSEFTIILSPGDTISYGLYTYVALNYWGYDSYTSMEVTRVK